MSCSAVSTVASITRPFARTYFALRTDCPPILTSPAPLRATVVRYLLYMFSGIGNKQLTSKKSRQRSFDFLIILTAFVLCATRQILRWSLNFVAFGFLKAVNLTWVQSIQSAILGFYMCCWSAVSLVWDLATFESLPRYIVTSQLVRQAFVLLVSLQAFCTPICRYK